MMRNIEVYRDSGAIDIALIEDFENHNKVKFPLSYKALLLKHNAVRLENNNFKFFHSGTDSEDSRDINFFGYGLNISESNEIGSNQDHDVYGHDYVIAFGCAANGDYVCFDYRDIQETDNPSIVVMFHDDYDENNKMIVCHVADSFEQFIDMLYKYDG